MSANETGPLDLPLELAESDADHTSQVTPEAPAVESLVGGDALAGEELVDEAGLAEMLDLPVSTIRAMLSGSVPIPDDLVGVFPKATLRRSFVWRAEDAARAAEKLKRKREADALALEQEVLDERERQRRALEEEASSYASERDSFMSADSEDEDEPERPRRRGFFWWLFGRSRRDNGAHGATVIESDVSVTEAGDGDVLASGRSVTDRDVIENRDILGAERDSDDFDSLISEMDALTPSAEPAAKLSKAELREKKRTAVALRKEEAQARRAKEKERARAARAQAKVDKAEAKAAYKERLKAHKIAMATWREDAKLAKATGVSVPQKPRKPKVARRKPKPLEIINATRAFAVMLDNAPGELESLDAMLREFADTQIGDSFRRIRYRVADQNMNLVEAFAPERVFPSEVHNMLEVGAKTINTGEALRTAVRLMETTEDAKRKMRGGVGQSLMTVALSLVALFVVAWTVMPEFVTMYEALEVDIPPISNAVLVLSNAIVWILGTTAVASALYGLWWFAHGRKLEAWRTIIDEYKLRLPLVGKANQSRETHHVLRVLATYLSVGYPEREALVDTAAATGNRAIRKHILSVAELMVQGRKTLPDVFDSPLFPTLVRALVATGQQSGRVNETIIGLEGTYAKEAEVDQEQAIRRVENAVALAAALIFMVVITIVTLPPLEMVGVTLDYN